MILRVRKSTTIVTVSLAILGLFGLIMGTFITHPVAAAQQAGRLISVHDRGKETVFLTEADTLEQAFKEVGIEVDPRDAVEPAINEKLVASDYQVNIYRARPVTVVDGSTRLKVVTPYQTAEQIVADAGISLNQEDTTSLSRSTDFVSDGAGLKLTIDRATPLTLDLYGKKTEIRTQAETVGDMFKEKNIKLTENDRASLSDATPISEGMEIRVWREGIQTISADEAVAFAVEQIKDADRPVGYKEVQTVGVQGMRSVTYEIEVRDGKEVSRTEIAAIVTTQPQTQIEIIGSKPATLPYTGGGSKTDWLAASNIPEESWGYADFMVSKESGWNPNAVNKSSGACGLSQALPCSKLGPNWNDPVVALNWMNSYVNGRYGGWQGAYNFWQKNHWY
ncbi:MAG: ubiquitin-like domain-containing protein [Candidatus Microsaccharimonas sp.]